MTSPFAEVAICGGEMKRHVCLGVWLLCTISPMSFAQQAATSDSLRLSQHLQDSEEIRLNPTALREFRQSFEGLLQPTADKPWLQPDETMPRWKQAPAVPKGRLTLSPYTPTTRYDWDPVAQKKIAVGKQGPAWAQWRPTSGGRQGGYDLMLIFTRDFWNAARKRRHARTREALAAYGDSITAFCK